MMTIKTTDCHPILLRKLKAGDIFSFVSAPDIVYIKTAYHSTDYECKECREDNSINLENYCVALETGAFYKANPYEKVFFYKKAELTLGI